MENISHAQQVDLSPSLPIHNLVSITQKELTELKWTGGYWKSQHGRVREREERLKQELAHKDAQIRDLRKRLYGKKSEKTSRGDHKSNPKKSSSENKRPRGQQKGSSGHGRTERPDLAVTEEYKDLPIESCSCRQCGLPYSPTSVEEISESIEIEVKAYKRRVHRKGYKKACSCPITPETPKFIVAPPVPKVIPRSPFGATVWEHILLGKFLYSQPLHRILQDLKSHGLPISQGTITGGLQKLSNLFTPVNQALYEKQMEEKIFHNDETRWEVYEAVEGKVGHRWYLWVTRSSSVIYYKMDPTRSADVPMAHFSQLKNGKVVVVCDRYSAYKKLARKNKDIILAFCWAHVRRDFLDLTNSYPTLQEWGLDWVDEIATLYHLNQQRLEHWQENASKGKQSFLYHKNHAELKKHLQQMIDKCDGLLSADQVAVGSSQKQQSPPTPTTKGGKSPEKLHSAQRKVLSSLQGHWKGLTVFLDNPTVPMDNNLAEQAIRNPVNGRKDYYGSGSIWSATLAAMLFSIFQTMGLWKLNVRHWLSDYLEACALNGGKPPLNLDPFLPWQMTEERKQHLSKPKHTHQGFL